MLHPPTSRPRDYRESLAKRCMRRSSQTLYTVSELVVKRDG